MTMTNQQSEADERERRRTVAHRAKEARRIGAWRINNPDKQRAIELVGLAVRDYDLERGPCEKCGTNKNVCGFHDDYAQPLKVNWRCRSCNLASRHSPHHQSKGNLK